MTTITYTPFSAGAVTQDLTVWDGQNVAYLTPADWSLYDPQILSSIVATTDRVYEWYEAITGRDPLPNEQYNGHDTLAIIDITPAAQAMGIVGATGIELQPYVGERLIADLQQGGFERLPGYELGRNFWFYSNQLDAMSPGQLATPMANGFASVNQYLAAEYAGVDLLPVSNPGPGWTVTLDQMSHLLDLYLVDFHASWEDLLSGYGYTEITLPGQDFAATRGNLAGAMLYRIDLDYGDQAFADFFHELGTLGHAATATEARDNFLTAAWEATGEDYSWMFKEAGTTSAPPIVVDHLSSPIDPPTFTTDQPTAFDEVLL